MQGRGSTDEIFFNVRSTEGDKRQRSEENEKDVTRVKDRMKNKRVLIGENLGYESVRDGEGGKGERKGHQAEKTMKNI